MVKHDLLLLLAIGVTSVQAEHFVVRTEYDNAFENTDTTCSTWTEMQVEGVQDVCQPLGDADARGLTSPTGKAYIKRTCDDTHYFEGWYSDADCTSALVNVMGDSIIMNSTLACHYSDFHYKNIKYSCGQVYTAARWSRYTDNTCQSKNTAKPEEFYAVDFCRKSQTGSFEGDHKSQRYSCGSSGLERIFFKNSDCTGSEWVKTDAVVSNSCSNSDYYYGHVKLDVACTAAPSTSKANVPCAMRFLSLLVSLVISFSLTGCCL
jgi:hypothetical protein